jgi:hypothetical protein
VVTTIAGIPDHFTGPSITAGPFAGLPANQTSSLFQQKKENENEQRAFNTDDVYHRLWHHPLQRQLALRLRSPLAGQRFRAPAQW